VAGFLFPPPQAEHEGGDPFQVWLESSARLYRSLAEAAGFNLRALETAHID
jgi:hypothetical protein